MQSDHLTLGPPAPRRERKGRPVLGGDADVPSWRKSRATLQRLTGRESVSGVWMTCRSPAPKEMVLCGKRRFCAQWL